MPSETGIVSKIKPRDKTYSVAVNKQWFGGFGKCPVKEQDTVTIEWKQQGEYKNIVKIQPAPKETQKLPETDSKTNDIRLQVCIKAAGGVFAGTKATPQEVSTFAKELFTEVWGDA